MNRKTAYIAAALAGTAAIGAAAFAATFAEPRIDANGAPGVSDFAFPAAHHTAHNGGRVDGVIWYPSAGDGDGRLAYGNPVFHGVPADRGASIQPPEADASYPLVVLSHGLGGHHRSMAWLASKVANRGAVVVGMSHPHSSWGDFDWQVGLNHWSRAKDVSAAIDAALADPAIGPHIDPDRIMVVGFSYGGWTALSVAGVQGSHTALVEHCAEPDTPSSHCNDLAAAGVDMMAIDAEAWNASYKDSRVSHVIAVDPALHWGLDESHVADLDTDLRLIALGEDENRHYATDFDASGFVRLVPEAEINRFDPASHFMFLPLCKPEGEAILELEEDDPVCTDPEGANRAAVHGAVIDMVADDLGL